MQSLSEIRSLLDERGLRPKHRLGQHFLHDQNHLRRLVAEADVAPGELILEVGPGTGTLTEALLEAGAEVIACELDADLAALLHDRLGERVHLVEGDCLARGGSGGGESGRRLSRAVTAALGGRPFKLVANLPYQAASPLIITLLVHHPACRGMWVTIQKEVAERLQAPPRTRTFGALSVIVRAFADVHEIAHLAPSCFWPRPKVESTMFAIVPRSPQGPGAIDAARAGEFARFIVGLFSKRRKQLGTIVGRNVDWPEGITADLRPEALEVEQLVALWKSLHPDPRNEGN